MSKLYFVETNGGWLTVATDDDGRACYMWQDGTEENYPSGNPDWDDADDAQREQIAAEWLESIKEYNCFDSLYADCDTSSGYTGVYTTEEFEKDLDNGCSVVAEIDF